MQTRQPELFLKMPSLDFPLGSLALSDDWWTVAVGVDGFFRVLRISLILDGHPLGEWERNYQSIVLCCRSSITRENHTSSVLWTITIIAVSGVWQWRLYALCRSHNRTGSNALFQFHIYTPQYSCDRGDCEFCIFSFYFRLFSFFFLLILYILGKCMKTRYFQIFEMFARAHTQRLWNFHIVR